MSLRDDVIRYSAKIGSDPLLIQGAGGNVSWKEGGTLWVKASGTWLAEAESREIFVAVDLPETIRFIERGVSDFSEAVVGNSTLRPSIETPLHALLPHNVVVHVHSVEVLARVVLSGARDKLDELLTGVHWAWVDYAKPGSELARAVVASMSSSKEIPDVLVLANHGLVVAGKSVVEVDKTLRIVIARLEVQPRPFQAQDVNAYRKLLTKWSSHGYRLPIDASLHQLAQDRHCFRLAQERWALYPDHVVFLGEFVPAVDPETTPDMFLGRVRERPACVIVSGEVVLVREDISPAQEVMIGCYAAVTSRLHDPEGVVSLSRSQISDLLDWEAEKYRQKVVR